VPIVLESGGRRDTLFSLDVGNRGDRPVRVDGIRIVYLEGERAVRTVEDATSLFTDAGLLSDPRVEPGASVSWSGLCLVPPTPATDRVRLELQLAQRRGLKSQRATQRVDVPLARPGHLPSIALPVRGAWRITQGHTCGTDHRRSPLGSEFAWDMAAVDEPDRDPSAGGERRNATFGRPVHAPVAGRVVAAVGSVADNEAFGEAPRRSFAAALRNPLWFFGNFVVVDAGGFYVLLAHLRQGSLAVEAGDTVREGDLLAYAGNSGNTAVPHLHVQVMNRADPADPEVEGLPALFRDYVEATTRGEGTRRESVVRRVAKGDPPLGAVIFSGLTEPGEPATR
jgi:hypothetical protein